MPQFPLVDLLGVVVTDQTAHRFVIMNSKVLMSQKQRAKARAHIFLFVYKGKGTGAVGGAFDEFNNFVWTDVL